MDFDTEMDEVLDEVFAEDAVQFAGTVAAAAVVAVEFALPSAGETPASHPTFGGVAFDDDELLDMEGHVGGRFGEGAVDADEGEAGLGWHGAAGHDDPFPIVPRVLDRAGDLIAGSWS